MWHSHCSFMNKGRHNENQFVHVCLYCRIYQQHRTDKIPEFELTIIRISHYLIALRALEPECCWCHLAFNGRWIWEVIHRLHARFNLFIITLLWLITVGVHVWLNAWKISCTWTWNLPLSNMIHRSSYCSPMTSNSSTQDRELRSTCVSFHVNIVAYTKATPNQFLVSHPATISTRIEFLSMPNCIKVYHMLIMWPNIDLWPDAYGQLMTWTVLLYCSMVNI